MAVIGLGTDISEIERVNKALSRSGLSFAERILTEQELLDFNAVKQQARFLAKRFAAKEAASKALGTGIACGVTFHDFVVHHDDKGKPLLTLQGKALQLATQQGVKHTHISISDERHYAMASVILES